MAESARPIILDMDPGVDDALAILLAVRSPDTNVKAITICGGNVGLDQCALNALKTLRIAATGPEPPVARGASRPLRRAPFRASGIHGPDGLGDTRDRYPDPPVADLDPRHAVDVILEAARKHPDARHLSTPVESALTVVATGPLTNVALAISADPEAMRRVSRIVWMGGAFATHGNITPTAEFNAYCDPDAAQEVLSFGVPMTLVGLDACMQCPLSREELRQITGSKETPRSRFLWDICQMYMDFYRDHEGFDGCYLHDPLAVGVALWPDLIVRKELHHVQVVTEPGPTWGMTVIDRRPRNPWRNPTCRSAIDRVSEDTASTLRAFGVIAAPPHVDVALGVNVAGFLKRFVSLLAE